MTVDELPTQRGLETERREGPIEYRSPTWIFKVQVKKEKDSQRR